MARAGSADNVLPAPINFRGCGSRAECLLAREVLRTATVRVRFPAAAPISRQAGHQRAVESPKLRRSGAAPERLANRGRGRQALRTPALQAGPCGSVTRRLHQFHRGENEIQVSLISSTFVGATPTPATNLREVIRLPGCNPGVAKRAGSDDWSVTSTSHQLDP